MQKKRWVPVLNAEDEQRGQEGRICMDGRGRRHEKEKLLRHRWKREELEMVREICVLLMLGINAWLDHRKREISLGSLIFFGGAAVLLFLCGKLEWNLYQLLALLPGLVLLLTAIASEGKVGIGDGLTVLTTGAYLTLDELLWVVCVSLFVASLYSGFLFWRDKEGADLMIPYIPFLLGAYVGGLCLWIR